MRQDGRWVESGNAGSPIPACSRGRARRPWGLALGMGLDRMLMLIKGIPDIRLLRSADPRIADQMRDLARYQPVSSMPPITRDLSVAVAEDEDEETLGDRVRDALGADAPCVEEVRAFRYRLRPAARISGPPPGGPAGPEEPPRPRRPPGPEKTLTNEAANSLRDRIYLAIHQGTDIERIRRATRCPPAGQPWPGQLRPVRPIT